MAATAGIKDGDDVCKLFIFDTRLGQREDNEHEKVCGQPARRRDPTAKTGPGWAATIAPEDADAGFADFYANDSHFYIRRSLTLLPGETRRIWSMLNALYMEDPRVRELDGLERGISRAQIEFLAARASALLGCYY